MARIGCCSAFSVAGEPEMTGPRPSNGGETTPGNAGCWNEGSKHRAQAEPHGLSFIPLDLQRQELKEQACLLKWLHNSSLRRCDRGINSTLFLDISFFLDRNIVLGL
jgi:hypothetical protein